MYKNNALELQKARNVLMNNNCLNPPPNAEYATTYKQLITLNAYVLFYIVLNCRGRKINALISAVCTLCQIYNMLF